MEFVKSIGGKYINMNHVTTIDIEPAYSDGKPWVGKYWVSAFIPLVGTNILFVGTEYECYEFVDGLVNKQ